MYKHHCINPHFFQLSDLFLTCFQKLYRVFRPKNSPGRYIKSYDTHAGIPLMCQLQRLLNNCLMAYVQTIKKAKSQHYRPHAHYALH